jgi:hypothetical protein
MSIFSEIDPFLSLAIEIGKCDHSMAHGVWELISQSIEKAEKELGIELNDLECSSLLKVLSCQAISQSEKALALSINTLRVMALALDIYSTRAPDLSYRLLNDTDPSLLAELTINP